MRASLTVAGADQHADAHGDDGHAHEGDEADAHAHEGDEAHEHDEHADTHADDGHAHAPDQDGHSDTAQSGDDNSAADAASDAQGPAGDFDREIVLTLSEFAIEPGAIEVSHGETVRLTLENIGLIGHEFILSTEHGLEEHLAAGHDDHGSADAGHGHGEIIVPVRAGETAQIDVTFDGDADYTVAACLLPGHYEAGMHASLIISGP